MLPLNLAAEWKPLHRRWALLHCIRDVDWTLHEIWRRSPHKINATNQEAIIWAWQQRRTEQSTLASESTFRWSTSPVVCKAPSFEKSASHHRKESYAAPICCASCTEISSPTSQSSECGGPRETFISHNGRLNYSFSSSSFISLSLSFGLFIYFLMAVKIEMKLYCPVSFHTPCCLL